MKKNIFALITFQSILIMLLFFTGCKKDGNLGLDILPKGDEVIFKYDTIAVSTYTFAEDSSYAYSTGTTLLGSLNDPFLGKSNANFLIQLFNTTSSFIPDDIIEIDSIILKIPFLNVKSDSIDDELVFLPIIDSSYYGDLNNPLSFRVYELTQEILTDTVYYSNMDLTDWHEPIEMLNSEVSFSGEEGYLKFMMPEALKTKFKGASQADFETSETFLEFFKGVYLTCDEQTAQGGAILSLNTNSANAGLVVYYRANNAENSIDTTSAIFNFNYAAHINIFEQDYMGTLFENNIGNTTVQDSVTYVQGMDGLTTRVLIGSAELAKYENKILYDARLVVTLQDTLQDAPIVPYAPSPSLTLVKSSDDFLVKEPIAEYYTTSGYLGEPRNEEKYTFSITRYVQELLDGNTNNTGLFIKDNQPQISAKRTVLRSGNNSKPMQIVIKYSDLPSE